MGLGLIYKFHHEVKGHGHKGQYSGFTQDRYQRTIFRQNVSQIANIKSKTIGSMIFSLNDL